MQCLCILPITDDAIATVQNFNILVSEAPVDAEIIVQLGGHKRVHVVATENEDAVFFVGWWQIILQVITQSHVDDIRHTFKEFLAP